MPSGKRLTQEQVDAILRLAGEEDTPGHWRLTYSQIGAQLTIHRCTVYRVIRRAAVSYGRKFSWRATESR